MSNISKTPIYNGINLGGSDIANAGKIQIGRTFHNVTSFEYSGTAAEIVIKTKIPYVSSSLMPYIHLHGYAYGLSAPIELKVAFYIYGGNFVSLGAVSLGAWQPTIKLFSYLDGTTNYVALAFTSSIYFCRFSVNYQDIWGGTTRDYSDGWSVEYTTGTTIVGTDNLVTVPYKSILMASDVLEKIKTVDGSGSGLDADLLDGNHASAFATSLALQSESTTRANADNTFSTNISNLTTALTALQNWKAAMTEADTNSIVDTISEVIALFQNVPEGTDIYGILNQKINVSAIVDNLTSVLTNVPLSANQGRVLNGLITTLQSSSHTHSNKTILDAIQEALTTTLKSHYDTAYTHSQSSHNYLPLSGGAISGDIETEEADVYNLGFNSRFLGIYSKFLYGDIFYGNLYGNADSATEAGRLNGKLSTDFSNASDSFNFDSNVEPTQTGTSSKTHLWSIQYLLQGLKWLYTNWKSLFSDTSGTRIQLSKIQNRLSGLKINGTVIVGANTDVEINLIPGTNIELVVGTVSGGVMPVTINSTASTATQTVVSVASLPTTIVANTCYKITTALSSSLILSTTARYIDSPLETEIQFSVGNYSNVLLATGSYKCVNCFNGSSLYANGTYLIIIKNGVISLSALN
jgi:hypothetical protein